MTNAEKFLKDGVDKEKFCYELARHLNATVGNDEARTKEFMAIVDYFLNCLCVPTITEDERVILRNIDPKYEFIGKNDKNFLYIRISADNGNFAERLTGLDFVFPNLFQFIKNGEEYKIAELLKGE